MAEFERGPSASRISEARVRAGLDPHAVAQAAGLSTAEYDDLERYDDEAFSAISLETLWRLAVRVGMTAQEIVAPSASSEVEPVSMSVLVRELETQMGQRGETPDELSERLGWDVAPCLRNPTAAWTAWNVDCLQDLCRAVGLSWLGVLSSWPRDRAA